MSPAAALTSTVLIPMLGAVAIALLGSRPNLRETATIMTSVALLVTVWSLYRYAGVATPPEIALAEPIPGLAISLSVEPLGMLFALVASFLWIVTSLYAFGYMRGHGESHQTRFYFFFALSLAATMGIAFAANLFTLFVFYELLTLMTYPLVTHTGTEQAKRAGRLYLSVLLGSSIGLQLLALVWTWAVAGTLTFEQGGILPEEVSQNLAGALLVLYVFGVGKAAVMPVHRWLPAAMVAPTPVSALLHAVAVVKAGVFTILKIVVYVFGLERISTLPISLWLSYVAAVTIIIASVIAMRQDNLKLRLAYSTVSQLSYIVLGALIANRWGFLGGGLHILTHAFGKITLFFCAGAIMVATHKTEISQMNGLGHSMPLTTFAFLLGSLSVIGLPPLGGMWSKWLLALATVEADQLLLLGVLLLSTLLNVAYLLPIPVRAFFRPLPEGEKKGIREAPLLSLLALTLTSCGCIALFFYPDTAYRLLAQVVP